MKWMLNKPPYTVQTEARNRSYYRRGYLYWMDMGLGKTGTVLSEFAEYREDGKVDCLVVICPNNFQNTWVAEAQAMGLTVDYLVWPLTVRQPKNIKTADMVVINWESLIYSGGDWVNQHFLSTNRKIFFCIDEVHVIKNYQSKITKWCRTHWKNAVIRRGLTGTPMSQSVMDLYPQLRMAYECDGINPVVFRNRYAKMGGFMGKQVVGIQDEKIKELQEILDRCSFRALKSEWLDLPEKMYVPAFKVEMPDALRKHYKPMEQEFVTTLDNGDDVQAEMVISQLLKLQEISSGFIIDANREPVPLMDPAKIPKYQVAFNLIDAVGETSKILIFTYFKYTTRCLIDAIERKFNFMPAYLIGGMDASEVTAQKAAFNSDGGPSVMVAQLSVGNASHTLLGGATRPCHSVFYLENSYRLLYRKQSEDRIHRIGQRNACSYYDVASSGIEADIIKALQAKNDLVRTLIDHKTEYNKQSHGW